MELKLHIGFVPFKQPDPARADVVRARSAPVVRVAEIVDASRSARNIRKDNGMVGDICEANIHLHQMMASPDDASCQTDYLRGKRIVAVAVLLTRTTVHGDSRWLSAKQFPVGRQIEPSARII